MAVVVGGAEDGEAGEDAPAEFGVEFGAAGDGAVAEPVLDGVGLGGGVDEVAYGGEAQAGVGARGGGRGGSQSLG